MNSDSITDQEIIAVLNLIAIDGIGTATILRLVERLGSAEAVFAAAETELRAIPRLYPDILTRIKSARADGDLGRKQFEQAAERGIAIRTYWHADYPPKLRELESDAPALLFIRGKFAPDARRLAIVGTRSASAYGHRMTRDIVMGLRGTSWHVVSGLASGIDSHAHEAALEANLTTEAVFGCGVDRVYPATNLELAQRILDSGGGLVSEFLLGTSVDRHHFPQRNRIIAGLTEATLVVEAGDRSGALITARLALEYNREVMAVPGAVSNPKSRGCHELIKTGAALIEKGEDILQILDSRHSAAAPSVAAQLPLDLPAPESTLVAALDASEARHIDAVAEQTKMPVGEALGQLLLLELKGLVRQLPGKYFVRA